MLLEDACSRGLLFYEVEGFAGVPAQVVQFGVGGLDVFEAVGDYAEERIGVVSGWCHALAVEVAGLIGGLFLGEIW